MYTFTYSSSSSRNMHPYCVLSGNDKYMAEKMTKPPIMNGKTRVWSASFWFAFCFRLFFNVENVFFVRRA